jgi:hypothetical protein
MSYIIQRPPLAKSFFLPSKDALLSLQVGDLVKIMFTCTEGGVERMWVQITKQQDVSEWTGKLDNDPSDKKISEILKAGDEIIFHPLDIIQIWKEEA